MIPRYAVEPYLVDEFDLEEVLPYVDPEPVVCIHPASVGAPVPAQGFFYAVSDGIVAACQPKPKRWRKLRPWPVASYATFTNTAEVGSIVGR